MLQEMTEEDVEAVYLRERLRELEEEGGNPPNITSGDTNMDVGNPIDEQQTPDQGGELSGAREIQSALYQLRKECAFKHRY
jgi:hypothetical protein